MADWWQQSGQQGNWWDQYANILNPEGQADFDYGVYNATPVAQMYQEELRRCTRKRDKTGRSGKCTPKHTVYNNFAQRTPKTGGQIRA
jgi:hypothetical protein